VDFTDRTPGCSTPHNDSGQIVHIQASVSNVLFHVLFEHGRPKNTYKRILKKEIAGDGKKKEKKRDWRCLQLNSRFNCLKAGLMYAIFSASMTLKQNTFNWLITKARISTSDVSLIRFSSREKLQQSIATKKT